MDWENKFSSIVRETESNLAKVKERLGTARAVSHHVSSIENLALNDKMEKSYLSDQYPRTSGGLQQHSSMPSSWSLGQAHSHSPLAKSSFLPAQSIEGKSLPLEASPGIITLLQDKIEAQAKAIDSLTRTVQRLQEEKELQSRLTNDLREEVAALSSRVCEKGVDLQTERKLDQWRREVMGEIQVLQHQLQIQRSRDDALTGLHDNHSGSVVRELHDVKRGVQTDCDSLRRDIDNVRGRIVKAELDIAGVLGDMHDLNRKHNRMDRSLQDLSTQQTLTLNEDMKYKPQQHVDSKDITQLQSSLRGLQEELSKLQHSRDNVSKVRREHLKRPPKSHRAADTRPLSPPSPTPSDLVDLDLSDSFDGDLMTTEFSFSTKNAVSRSQDPDDPDFVDTADLNLTTDDLSSDGDALDFDELQ